MKWEMVKIGDHCTVTSSKRFHLAERADVGIPFYCSKEVIEKVNGKEVTVCDYITKELYEEIKNKFGVPKAGDLLITTRGTYGVPYIYRESDCFYFADGNLTWLKDFDSDLSPVFLYYWIISYEGKAKIDTIAKGTAQKAVPISSIKTLQILLPSIEDQHRIADVLSAYDDLIENNQKQIKLLEEAAQRLYKEWFVDLRFPGWENAKIVDGVPEGWTVSKISDICETVGGGTPSTKILSYYEHGNIPWVTPTDITRKKSLILLETEKMITKEGLEHSSAKMLPPETILMTSRASVGFFGICDKSVCTNQGFISCIPKRKTYQMFILFNLLNRVEEIRQKAGGSTYLEITKNNFRNINVIIPNYNLLELFQKYAYNFLLEIRKKEKENYLLSESRDRLLPKLMSGELEV